MGDTTGIAWTDHTFNGWWGCTNISAGCDNCYAETLAHRYKWDVWGAGKTRRTFGDKHWAEPLKWNEQAVKDGRRHRVFAMSMADVFDVEVPREWLDRLWALIRATPMLDWQLLTKRHTRIRECLPADWGNGYPNVWLGVSAENQHWADERIPALLKVPAVMRFVSAEPLLGPIDFRLVPNFNRVGLDLSRLWVIVGGESGKGARPMAEAWARLLREQCKIAGVPYFFKQWGDASPARQVGVHHGGGLLDGVQYHEFPQAS